MRHPASLPPHLEPAREFYHAIAEMIAAAVLRDLLERGERSTEVTERPRIRLRLRVVK